MCCLNLRKKLLKTSNNYPDCDFRTSTLIREFPPYAVTATARDMGRNTCPIHANVRHLVKAVNKVLKKDKIDPFPVSCRELSTLVICTNEFTSIDPLTWKYDCAMRECNDCPDLVKVVPAQTLKKEVQFSQWKSVKTKVKNKEGKEVEKNVFGIYSETAPLGEVIDSFREMLDGLCQHIFVAHSQWNAHKVQRLNLDSLSCITTEDYQMNITLEYAENPTSLSYSTNKVVFALYPICIEYLDEANDLKKGALAFLSEDRKHDHQQVQHFEEAMFKVIRDKVRDGICYWSRFTDGCGAQFKSKHTVAELMEAPIKFNLLQAGFHFFASHEGKNLSDTIGSHVKAALRRGMLKDEDLEVRTVDQAIAVINSNLKDKTKTFQFFLVQPFPEFERNLSRKELAITGIKQLHSMTVVSDNLYAREISCINCTLLYSVMIASQQYLLQEIILQVSIQKHQRLR